MVMVLMVLGGVSELGFVVTEKADVSAGGFAVDEPVVPSGLNRLGFFGGRFDSVMTRYFLWGCSS
jgi:hypothetical protein